VVGAERRRHGHRPLPERRGLSLHRRRNAPSTTATAASSWAGPPRPACATSGPPRACLSAPTPASA
jgi:hypothetical protein